MKKILVLEDEASIRSFVVINLKRSGYEPIEAATGEEALEMLRQNPDIKVLSVDGVAPTAENIRNGSYPIVTPMYAVTYEENTNENVDLLLQWILSEEGQYIIEETGYVGVSD